MDVELSTLEDGDHVLNDTWVGMIRQDASALIAASFPVKPPTSWFTDPGLKRLAPLTIDNSGRVSGHIAGWKTPHISMAGGVRPPRSKSGYAFFRTGSLETQEGDMVDVGQITLSGGHAPLEASVSQAVAHYDDTKSAIMDVACGEDQHGIWVAGALRPDVDESKIRAIRASSVSGDWRPINGKLELVAVCAVNCPGFPIPRAHVASGVPTALIAAGSDAIVQVILDEQAGSQLSDEIEVVLASLQTRMKRLEAAFLDSDSPLVASAPRAAASDEPAIKRLRRERDMRIRVTRLEGMVAASAAAARVALDEPAGEIVAPADPAQLEAIRASLRASVHGPAATDEDLKADLRRRVRGSVTK